jgi:hypothetical protein
MPVVNGWKMDQHNAAAHVSSGKTSSGRQVVIVSFACGSTAASVWRTLDAERYCGRQVATLRQVRPQSALNYLCEGRRRLLRLAVEFKGLGKIVGNCHGNALHGFRV